MALLEVNDLHVSFFTPAGEVKAVSGVSFGLERGKVLGIVGESGSGKSVTAYSIMQLLEKNGKITSGSIRFDGFEYPLSDKEKALLSDYEGKIITLGVRPENVVPDNAGYVDLSVTLNENLGQNTLVHGTVNGHKLIAKVRDWCTYKNGDNVKFSFNRVHFFDKETTNAIR